MANRYLRQFQYTFEQDTVTLFGTATIGASGAVTAGTVKGGGIASVTKESTAGQYTIRLSDRYSKLLDVSVQIIDDAIADVAAVQLLQDPATLVADFRTTPAFKVQCVDKDGAAVNPPSGSALLIRVVCRNSTVGPWD